MKNSMIAFAHYLSLIKEDMGVLLKDCNSAECDFESLMLEINHAMKYDTFFKMFTDTEDERVEMDESFFNTFLTIIGLQNTEDIWQESFNNSHIKILRDYIDTIMHY